MERPQRVECEHIMDRLVTLLLSDRNDEIRRNPEAYYQKAREAARRLAEEQLKEEAEARQASREEHLV